MSSSLSERTTIFLGRAERAAAKRLAAQWGVTPSEAIRRALLQVADAEVDAHRARRARERRAALNRLIRLPRKTDVAGELERISQERDAW